MIPRNEPALITKERAISSDDFRAQVRFHTIRDKLTYAILHGHMSKFSPAIAAESRDTWRAMILAKVIENSEALARDPMFMESLEKFIQEKVSPEYLADARVILTSIGLWPNRSEA